MNKVCCSGLISFVSRRKGNLNRNRMSIIGGFMGILGKYGLIPGNLMRIHTAIFGLFPGMNNTQSGDIYLGTLMILAFVFSFMVLFFWLIAVIIELFRKKS
ncbi:hypothetical protein ACNF40_02200 [Cuniculiplasma sp. SKW4]|uniref:hypothetical protein n=1 Tax=Cuniculiplasma sp. SKW4 TaxID=3400171 RepID=UPI003FD5BCF5